MASAEKQRIEEQQRNRRKWLEENNIKYQPRFFKWVYFICLPLLLLLLNSCHVDGTCIDLFLLSGFNEDSPVSQPLDKINNLNKQTKKLISVYKFEIWIELTTSSKWNCNSEKFNSHNNVSIQFWLILMINMTNYTYVLVPNTNTTNTNTNTNTNTVIGHSFSDP